MGGSGRDVAQGQSYNWGVAAIGVALTGRSNLGGCPGHKVRQLGRLGQGHSSRAKLKLGLGCNRGGASKKNE